MTELSLKLCGAKRFRVQRPYDLGPYWAATDVSRAILAEYDLPSTRCPCLQTRVKGTLLIYRIRSFQIRSTALMRSHFLIIFRQWECVGFLLLITFTWPGSHRWAVGWSKLLPTVVQGK